MLKVSEGDIKNASDLIRRGVDVNVQNNNGMTALMIASEAGHVEIIEEMQQIFLFAQKNWTRGRIPRISQIHHQNYSTLHFTLYVQNKLGVGKTNTSAIFMVRSTGYPRMKQSHLRPAQSVHRNTRKLLEEC